MIEIDVFPFGRIMQFKPDTTVGKARRVIAAHFRMDLENVHLHDANDVVLGDGARLVPNLFLNIVEVERRFNPIRFKQHISDRHTVRTYTKRTVKDEPHRHWSVKKTSRTESGRRGSYYSWRLGYLTTEFEN